jgi:hypothetical protein
MLLLNSTSDKLQLVTDSTATVTVHASYLDYNGTAVTPGRTNSAINSATTTDIVGAPGSGIERIVKSLTVKNTHATTTVTATIKHTDGSTTVELVKVTLLAGEKLIYFEGLGFRVLDIDGVLK